MKKATLMFFVGLMLLGGSTHAEGPERYSGTSSKYFRLRTGGSVQRTVSGRVSGSQGPLEGATVRVSGTDRATNTSADGSFSIQAVDGEVLTFSYVGYHTVTQTVDSRDVYNIILQDEGEGIDEVVVTALGITREKRGLGYAVQDIRSEELMKNKQPNLINSLNGKIAGVNITNSGGAPGASASIVIRGGTSLERDNQPLFVIDGMPIDNSTGMGDMSAFDGNVNISTTNSNRAMDINPEDVESISVLKGPTAAALYGIRAAAGAIVITTKKGKEGVVSAGVNSRTGANWVNKLPELQKRYKQGSNLDGAGVDLATYYSWGDEFSSGETIYNNMEDFFETGYTFDNSFNVSGGNARGNFYLSGAHLQQNGIVPTTDYERANFRFNGEQKLGLFTFGANAAYSQASTTKTLTGTGLWGTGGNGYMESIIAWPQSANMKDWKNLDGSQKFLFTVGNDMEEILLAAIDNPYWTIHMNPQSDKTNRFLGTFYTNAKLTDWLGLTYRLGVDNYTSTYNTKISAGSAVERDYQRGMLSQNIRQYNFLTNNLLIDLHKEFDNTWDVNLLLGASTENIETKATGIKAQNFVVPNFYSFQNAEANDRFLTDYLTQIRRIGVFGDLKVGYSNVVYAGVTLRNDWSSTLPRRNRSFFYPSYSLAVIFTELYEASGLLSYGKLRASWAGVGKDAPAYQTNSYLDEVERTIGGGYKNSWTLGNPNLVPEQTQALELGVDLRLFQNLLNLEFTYYNNKSVDQILSPRVDNATGGIFQYVNAGVLQNKGLELTLSTTPVKRSNFRWDLMLNLSGNRGKVHELPGGIDILYVTDVQVADGKAASYNGGDFMAISGKDWTKDEQGRYILDWETGLPTVNSNSTLHVGNREPSFIGGLNNSFSYKNWALSFLFDFRRGGDVFNGTNVLLTQYGLSKLTESRGNTWTMTGVALNPSTQQYEEVTKEFAADQNFYQNYYIHRTGHFIERVNWLRLRSIDLSYQLPAGLLSKSRFVKGASFTLNATNLLLFTNYSGMDPETSAAGAGVIGSGSVGVDYAGVPNTRGVTFGVNLKF